MDQFSQYVLIQEANSRKDFPDIQKPGPNLSLKQTVPITAAAAS